MFIVIIISVITGVVVLVSGLFVLVYLFLFQPFQVKGVAMMPIYPDSAYVITNKISYRSAFPKRGDIIIFSFPKNEDFTYIERIVGLPGESILIKNGMVYVNDNPLEESYLGKDITTMALGKNSFLKEGEAVVIPQNNYFALGDNRAHSSDSRVWGFVPKENIIGKVSFCYSNCSQTQ